MNETICQQMHEETGMKRAKLSMFSGLIYMKEDEWFLQIHVLRISLEQSAPHVKSIKQKTT